MKWKSKWTNLLFFLSGIFICYICTEWKYFKIEYELNIPELLISIGTAVVGVYIAKTIQRNVNKNQNQYSYIQAKLDVIWTSFTEFSQIIVYSNDIDLSVVTNLNKNIVHPISFLRDIFISFNIEDTTHIDSLEQKLDRLEIALSNIPANQNVISITNHKQVLETHIVEINKSFSLILNQIQDL